MPAMAKTPALIVQNVNRDAMAQTAHDAHVLLAAERVDDRTRSKKEQRLEERMRHQVKTAAEYAATPQPRNM